MKKEINVVAAVIVVNNKILCTQRNNTKYLPYKWEFPGGKVESGETEEEALIREIKEELECNIVINNKIIEVKHEYDFAIINLSTFHCNMLSDDFILKEHKSYLWALVNELDTLDWAAADIPVIHVIQETMRLS